MGISISYELGVECAEKELCAKLDRLKARALKLDGVAAEKVVHVEPCYSDLIFFALKGEGLSVPDAVARRVKEADAAQGDLNMRLWLASTFLAKAKEGRRCLKPAMDLVKSKTLWDPVDYPAKFTMGGFLTYTREGLLL